MNIQMNVANIYLNHTKNLDVYYILLVNLDFKRDIYIYMMQDM